MNTTLTNVLARLRFAAAVVASAALLGSAFATPAFAHISPNSCTSNDFVVNLLKSTNVAYDETNPNGATTVIYSAAAGNPNTSGSGCDVSDVTITITDPHGAVHTIQTGGNYPIGTAVATLSTTTSYVVNSTDESSGKVTASVHAVGVLHDTGVGDDPMDIAKSLSVTIIHPNTTTTITPSSSLVTASTSVNLTVTEQNTGDNALGNPTVMLTPPGLTLASTSSTFTGGDTGSDGILGVGETWTWVVPVVVNTTTTFTAVGNGLDSLGNPVTFPAYANEQASTTVTVRNSPTIATQLSATSVNIGTAVHDSATLAGATGDAGGTVTYTVYNDSACSTGAQDAGTVNVTNGIVPDSNAITFNTAGTFNWQAAYSGDTKNTAATSTCQTEVLTVNQPQVGTRTLGFWQTHTAFAESVFAGAPLNGTITLGGMTINSNSKLFGGFYANIAKTSAGTKRSALDQARMQLTQQYLAATLNCAYFTCSASTQTLLTQASADFSGTNVSAILADASALDAYNNSGDSLGSVSAGAATPSDSKTTAGAAGISFWDTLN